MPILAASLLTDEELVIGNVPRILDVDAMLALLEDLGVKVLWRDEHEVALRADAVRRHDVDEELGSRIRASFLLAGPLLARFGEAHMPPPGGDVIGRRRLDPHLDALKGLGARIEVDGTYRMSAPDGLKACDIFMDEPSVMATENAFMAAALAPGMTRIANAASEPHVQDLARLLVSMGAQIEASAPTPSPCTAVIALAAPATRSAPTTSRSRASWHSPPSREGSSASRRQSPRTCT